MSRDAQEFAVDVNNSILANMLHSQGENDVTESIYLDELFREEAEITRWSKLLREVFESRSAARCANGATHYPRQPELCIISRRPLSLRNSSYEPDDDRGPLYKEMAFSKPHSCYQANFVTRIYFFHQIHTPIVVHCTRASLRYRRPLGRAA